MKNTKWTFEKLKGIALRFNTKSDFKKNENKAYQAAKYYNILNKICEHMIILRKTWTFEELQQISLQYNTKKEFKKGNLGAYSTASKRGILNQICQHMALKRFKWSLEALQLEALQYNKKIDFQKNSGGAYKSALARGLLIQICQHMELKSWMFDEIQAAALKYQTRTEFAKNNHKAYDAALSRGILDIICQHMEKSRNISNPEQNLIDIVKQSHPNSINLKDRKVKIPNKPYIKGFDIDLYIPELRKGIEFDGTYWHSIEGLARSRKKWPEQDLLDYHNLKDTYFKSKGIEIYHVNERDWLENPNQCVKQVLDFLGNI